MIDLTLVIPAKNEKESLPFVFEELEKYNLKKIVILEKTDFETIKAIKNYNCKVIYQKEKGYGAALIEGISNVETNFFCIFNADGSFNPNELNGMYDFLKSQKIDLVFATRYEKDCSSDDDTFITYLGNYIFTKLGRLFFGLRVTDILYTFVMGKTELIKQLELKSKDFSFCVEMPIKASRANLKLGNHHSHERARIGGKKKVNAFKDGFLILISMLKLFFKI